jgi:hypothetical protein
MPPAVAEQPLAADAGTLDFLLRHWAAMDGSRVEDLRPAARTAALDALRNDLPQWFAQQPSRCRRGETCRAAIMALPSALSIVIIAHRSGHDYCGCLPSNP